MKKVNTNHYIACYHLSKNDNGNFISLKTGKSLSDIAKIYSLAKYGSFSALKFFANKIIKRFYTDIESSDSLLRQFFNNTHPRKDNIILMTPGYRNIKASGNIMFDLALPYINAKLVTLGFPILTDFKLVRLADPCPNYAMLSREERAAMAFVTDHILPGKSLYSGQNIHIIYGDDIYITGESSERARNAALSNGAISAISFFAVMMDTFIANKTPEVEEELNRSFVTEKLDDTALEIFCQPEMIPVIRTVELLLTETNLSELEKFLPRIPAINALKIYISYMSNESLSNSQFGEGVKILRNYLTRLGLVDSLGLPIWS